MGDDSAGNGFLGVFVTTHLGNHMMVQNIVDGTITVGLFVGHGVFGIISLILFNGGITL